MKFGHRENGRVVYASLPITIDGRDYFTDDASLMREAGEKEIIETEPPAPRADGTYTPSWRETETQSVREWTFVPETEEARHARYRGLCIRYIHEKYPMSDESKILREYLAYGEAHKAEFEAYNAYVEDCKARAYGEVYGDTTA